MLRRYPLVAFVALAYLITWPLQVAALVIATRAGVDLSNEDNFLHVSDLLALEATREQVLPLLLFNIGQFGPLVSAFAMSAVLYGNAGPRDLLRRMLRWRVAPRWYGVTGLLPLLLAGLGLAAAFLTDGLSLGPFEPALGWLAVVPFLLYMLVFTGIAEEPGWRGFALPHLQAGTSAYRASWLLGAIWGVWHVPFTLYFNRDEPWLLPASIIGLTVGIVGWTIVNSWIYNSTSSVLLLIVLHGWNNTVQSYLILSQSNFLAHTLFMLLPWGLAFLIERRYGKEDLAAGQRPQWWPGRSLVEQRGIVPRPPAAQTAPAAVDP